MPTACEHCASGCALRTDYRRDVVLRRQAWDDPEVNEEWNCDKGRFAFDHLSLDRLSTRSSGATTGCCTPRRGPRRSARPRRAWRQHAARAGVLTGGRLTLEDAYAYAKFARVALGTDDVDFRARAHSAEEAAFLGRRGRRVRAGSDVRRPRAAPRWSCWWISTPEDESPIVFLRLRKAVRERGTRVVADGAR